MTDILEDLRRWSDVRPADIAFSDADGTITYQALYARCCGLAATLTAGPATIGILAENGVDWVVADLACKLAGKTMVPLPPFFSPDQLRHIVADATIDTILSTPKLSAMAAVTGVPVQLIGRIAVAGGPFQPVTGWRQVIYTSGTTGRPKGVILNASNIDTSVRALTDAMAVQPTDKYLSVLPLSLLLEQVCGIYVPLKNGVRSHLDGDLAMAVMAGDMGRLRSEIERHRPTAMVLVPALLSGWVAWLSATGATVPGCLRFVAVGGAHVAPALARQAWSLGIPVHEGYGLSECGSVVAVNRPGQRKPGTVGPPLPGVHIDILDGEIVVHGATVMQGYLSGAAAGTNWRTGDLGQFDDDGNLEILGRRDNVLVTSYGRNISPEWIESMILADPRIAHCILTGSAQPAPVALIVLSAFGEKWAAATTPDDLHQVVTDLCIKAPAYARPARVLRINLKHAIDLGLLNALRQPVRREFNLYYSTLDQPVYPETPAGEPHARLL